MERRFMLLVLLAVLTVPAVNATTPRSQQGFQPELDVDIWLDPLDYYSVYNSMDQGDTVYVNVEVVSGGGIDFFICDQSNFDIFQALGSPYVYHQKQSVGSVSLSFTAPSSDTWYCVFFNDALLTSKHLEGYVGTTPQLSIGNEVLIPVAAMIANVVIGGAIWFRSMRKRQPAPTQVPPQQSYYAPSQASIYCPYCGTQRQSTEAKFCANCGRSFAGPDLG